jgi:hypothetical protein
MRGAFVCWALVFIAGGVVFEAGVITAIGVVFAIAAAAGPKFD